MGLDQSMRALTKEQFESLTEHSNSGIIVPDTVDAAIEKVWGGETSLPEPFWIGRKENHIQAWVERVVGEEPPNCGFALVSRADFASLVETLGKVLDDHDLAEEEMPTQTGFFFGNTDYDEYYFGDLQAEKETFSAALPSIPEGGGVAYWCWW